MSDESNIDESNFYPSPSRLVEGLRDTGYSYEAAFADIVDNSIAANATKIDIQIYQMVDGRLRVVVADNGTGMDKTTLLSAMRYGSPKRVSPKSLGKFGMGLKTASTAFCRKLTVFSSQNGKNNGRTWDIDEIVKSDKWILLTAQEADYEEELERLVKLSDTNTGTVVIWENIDRLLNHSNTKDRAELLRKTIKEISDHLSKVFGKFLDGNDETIPLTKIIVNDLHLTGWDPTGKWLNADGGNRLSINKKTLNVDANNTTGFNEGTHFELNGYILPNKSDMTPEEMKKLRYSNDNQGFYIYRENRMIYGGGWPHRLFTKEPHLNLLRIELNFDHDLDDYFQVDIRKTRIVFPQSLRTLIKSHLTPFRNEANKRYRHGSPRASSISPNVHSGSDKAIHKHVDENAHATVTITDKETGEVKIKNKFGELSVMHSKLVAGTDVSVVVKETLQDGCLWEFAINESGDICVILNESHEFYKKFYEPNINNRILIQAMDSVFWSLANCEIGTISEISKRNIEELRFLVSKDLRVLSEELPNVSN